VAQAGRRGLYVTVEAIKNPVTRFRDRHFPSFGIVLQRDVADARSIAYQHNRHSVGIEILPGRGIGLMDRDRVDASKKTVNVIAAEAIGE